MKLKTLKLVNFEGIKELEIAPEGKSMSIYGDNGTGKTTLADAQAWLLFNKDSAFTSGFLPKPRNDQGEELHNLDTEVEGTYILDNGAHITFRKVFAENWKKKRGSTEANFTGHTVSYYIDGVPKKETEYQAYLDSIADQRSLMVMSLPQYFPEVLDIRKRRELLMELINDIDDYDVIEACEELHPLKYLTLKPGATAVWYTMEEFIAVSKGIENQANDDLKEIPGRIDEANRSLSGVTEQRLADIKKKLTGLNAKKVELQLEKNAPKNTVEQSLLGDICALKAKIEEKRAEYAQKCLQATCETTAEADELGRRYSELSANTAQLRAKHQSKLAEAGRLTEARNELLQQWHEVNAGQYQGDTICPSCGQPIPEDRINEAVASFNERKSLKLAALSSEGQKCSIEVIAAAEAQAEKLKSQLLSAEADERKTKAELEQLREKIPDSVPFEQTKEYAQISEELRSTQTRLEVLKQGEADSTKELEREIADIDLQISELNIEVAGFEADKRIRERIKELEAQQKAAADNFAKAKQGLDLAELFGRRKAEMLTDKINSHFKNVRFRLFKTQINGGIQDDCEVLAQTSSGYIPYSTANNAARINAGLDIIKGFGSVWRNSMPVFVDNAESITKLEDEGLQVVRLVVSENDKKLRFETEE